MEKIKWLGLAILAMLTIGIAVWWTTGQDKDDPVNSSDAFVYSESGVLSWFELSVQKGNVEGKLFRQELLEEIGEEPRIEENKYSVTGKTTEKGYELKVHYDEDTKTFEAEVTGADLSIQVQNDSQSTVYKAVSKEELDKYKKDLEEEWESAVYHAEEKEKQRLRTFFSELDSVYGYLYTSENNDLQLLVKIDESTHQGEIMGSLHMMVQNENNSYKEERYELNGITDGRIVELYTTVDGKQAAMKGHFRSATDGFDSTFWATDEKISFHAITEAEFEQKNTAFKENTNNK